VPVHWFVTGSYGQLGSALIERLADSDTPVSGCGSDELDVAEPDAVRKRLASLPRPLVWANAAGFTQVDRCEREPELAARGNAVAPAVLAEACAMAEVRLVHVSTDYVFPGDAQQPYREDDPTGPRSVYGRTKLVGECAVLEASDDFLVVRTSWLFGAGRNFIAAVLDQAERRRAGSATGPLRVVDDQTGRPTYAVDLADAIVRLVEAGARGLVHVANTGIATWWDLARRALDEAGYTDIEIVRIKTSDLKTDAIRPAWSVLDTTRAESLGVRSRRWQDAVTAYLRSDHSPLAKLSESSAHA
jgi:dTDP-4-dehydrorhamnose reductase